MVLFWLLFCLLLALASAQRLDNFGSDFIVGFMPNVEPPVVDLPAIVELQLTGPVATAVQIEYPVGNKIEEVSVIPGKIAIVSLPTSASQGWPLKSVASNLVRASSIDGVEFTMYLINRAIASTDAALALPVDTFNSEYIVMDYNTISGFDSYSLVYAAFDGTTVLIQPPEGLGQPFEVFLNRGEGYLQALSVSQTGTIISSDRPVGVVNGNECANVPTHILACDHLYEVAHPVQTWGKFCSSVFPPKCVPANFSLFAMFLTNYCLPNRNRNWSRFTPKAFCG
jgi:IgGFc binding protein